MDWEKIALWAIVVANTFAILAIVRQLALLPRPPAPGPRAGAPFVNWALRTDKGDSRDSTEMPAEYTILFASETCRPCHALVEQLAGTQRVASRLVLAVDGNPKALLASAGPSQPFDELLIGATENFRRQLHIPGTPFAVAVRQRHVVAAGPARSVRELTTIADALGAH